MAGKLSWGAFKLIANGTRVSNHGADECVALANHHNEDVLGGTFVQVGSARFWWLNYNLMPALYKTFRQSQTPTPGAIAVWKPNAANGWHGHIGSVLDLYPDGTFQTLEQNYGVGEQRWAYRYRRRKDDSLYGFLVPHNNPAGNTANSQEGEMLDNESKEWFIKTIGHMLAFTAREGGVSANGRGGQTIFEKIGSVPDRIMDMEIDRQGGPGGKTTLRSFLAWSDANFQIIMALVKANAVSGGADPKVIDKAIRDALATAGLPSPKDIATAVVDEQAERLNKKNA